MKMYQIEECDNGKWNTYGLPVSGEKLAEMLEEQLDNGYYSEEEDARKAIVEENIEDIMYYYRDAYGNERRVSEIVD